MLTSPESSFPATNVCQLDDKAVSRTTKALYVCHGYEFLQIVLFTARILRQHHRSSQSIETSCTEYRTSSSLLFRYHTQFDGIRVDIIIVVAQSDRSYSGILPVLATTRWKAM